MGDRGRSTRGLGLLTGDRPAEAFEQLDAAVRVVPLRDWAMIAAVFLTIGAFGAFACWYQAPLKVDGRGILLAKQAGNADALLQVTAPASGRLARVLVGIGATVHAGDVLAEIDQKELADSVRSAEADLLRLKDEDARMSRFDDEEATSRSRAFGELKRTLDRNLTLDRSRLASYRKIAAGDVALRLRRYLSDSEALKSQAEADGVESDIGSTEARLFELSYERVRDETVRKRDKLKRELAIREADTKLGLLRDRLERDTRIVSPYAGKVVDLTITPHAPVEKGATAALLRPNRPPGGMDAIIFVPAGMGKKVGVGDAVEVSPDTVRRHEHGFIRGVVRSVSEIPATDQAMLAELKHPALVSSFVERYRGQLLLSLRVALRESAAAADERRGPSRENSLNWSSSSGAYQRVSNGTLCAASVVVEKRPLIALAMPWVKQLVGVD